MKSLFAVMLLVLCTATHAQVYRCNNTYTDEPCKDGKTIDTSPPVSDPQGPKTTVIYLCRAPSTYRYWTPEPCSKTGATIERTERVPSNLPWANQLAIARAQRDEAKSYSTPQQSTYQQQPIPAQQSPIDAQRQDCTYLETRIQYLDDEGRRGGGTHKMEWIRKERYNARNEQHRLRCR